MKYQARVQFDVYSTSKVLETRNCNAISFENKGTVTARLNSNYRLLPGQVLNISHTLPTVMDVTQYAVNFDLSDPGTTGTDQELAVITIFNEEMLTAKQEQSNCQKL